jgi:DNA-binding response OmpR family regulator
MVKTILIVEDERDILDLIEYTLQNEGYDTISCLDTKNVHSLLDEEKVDLILMDRNLPTVEGSLFIEKIREDGYNQPVIYISAKDKSDDIIDGFNRGGDDYITKPFNLNELKARVRAVLKRSYNEQTIIKIRDIIYDAKIKQFSFGNIIINLTNLEHDLLLEFIKNPNTLLTRNLLLENVWNDSYEKQLKTVNVAIKRLKEKIDPHNTKKYFKTVRGQGYIFVK